MHLVCFLCQTQMHPGGSIREHTPSIPTAITLTGDNIMNRESPSKEVTPCEYAGILGDSEDSADEPYQEDQVDVSWDDLPILKRLGLCSGADMTEEEVESAFAQLSLAFSCDQYTLTQRLQAEEHDRSVAQENFHLEVGCTKETLQSLRRRCADDEWSDMLSGMEDNLDSVLGHIQEVISAAEILGAVLQESKVSCAVEMMQIHMEHLKRQHMADSAELTETRKRFHRSRGRIHSDSEDGDRHLFVRQGSQQLLLRRRVSMTLVPTQSQLSDLETKFQEGCKETVAADTDSQRPEESTVSQASNQSAVSPMVRPSYIPPDSTLLFRQNSTQSQEDESDAVGYPSPLQKVLRNRQRPDVFEREDSLEEAKVKMSLSRSGLSELSPADDVCVNSELSVILSEERPLMFWLSRLGSVFLVLLLLVLCLLLGLGLLLWGLRSPPDWSSTVAT